MHCLHLAHHVERPWGFDINGPLPPNASDSATVMSHEVLSCRYSAPLYVDVLLETRTTHSDGQVDESEPQTNEKVYIGEVSHVCQWSLRLLLIDQSWCSKLHKYITWLLNALI